MIRTLIVDDERLARERLQTFLRDFAEVEIVGTAKNGPQAIQAIDSLKPDVVFLDVQMPGVDGFGVLQAVRHRPQVVFATAYDQYAIRAFEVCAVDYLLKPISKERLAETMRRVRDRLVNQTAPPAIEEILAALEARERRYIQQVPAQRGRNIVVLSTEQILWFEVEDRIVFAYVDGDRFMTNFTLRELEERLDPNVFFRAHKSRLVNLKHVKAIVPWFGGRYKLVMKDQRGSELELSRAQTRSLRSRMHW
ncbi:MAG: LytTR family DNA-binding domain-containing protein [Candidatus Binatia bacterium]|nr:LytTR family DNA-binding domain-containing protein [Candidatus Binatia bacterium]